MFCLILKIGHLKHVHEKKIKKEIKYEAEAFFFRLSTASTLGVFFSDSILYFYSEKQVL